MIKSFSDKKLRKMMFLLLAGLSCVGVGAGVKFHEKPLSGYITVTAHSGCMGLPDNSIEAMKAGIEAGAQIVEFDLNFTKDGEPVLSHDAPSTGKSYVTPEEAFTFVANYPGIQMNIDVKNTEYIEKVPPLADKDGVKSRIFFTGIGEEDVPCVREKCPGIPYYLNTSVKKSDDFQALCEKTAALGAVGININWKNASHRLVDAFHKNNMPVSVWTVNKAGRISKMSLLGVDNITTRRPDIACKLI
ncbi:MAG: glycerophosphodiester phosphodiesterase [Clostridiales bacterium]|nr:glycerophosphodiester phosphodiesterase [Clostridiales bacterium]